MASPTIDSSNTPLEFPCRYPVKVMGPATEAFEQEVREIIQNFVAPLEESDITRRASRKGTYVSLTFTVHAASRDHLEKIYQRLHTHKDVMQTL